MGALSAEADDRQEGSECPRGIPAGEQGGDQDRSTNKEPGIEVAEAKPDPLRETRRTRHKAESGKRPTCLGMNWYLTAGGS